MTRTTHRTRTARPTIPGRFLSVATGAALFLFLASAMTPALADEPAAPRQPDAASTEPENGAARPERWSVGLGAGLLSASGGPSGSFTFDHGLFGAEPGEFDTDYQGGDASLYELSLGVRLRDRLRLGLAWSRSSLSEKASVAARLPHPFLFDNHRSVDGTERNLSRDETALHLSLKWLVRDADKVQVALFAGPSRIDIDYDLVSAVNFSQRYPFDSAAYSGVEKRQRSGDAVGLHAGVDVAWYFSGRTGLGGVARWSNASIDLDAPDGSVLTVDGGGLQVVLDLRFRF